VKVEWDAEKSRTNQQKHGLSFDEAQELFLSGEDYLEIFDRAHSVDEERFLAIGPVRRGVISVVWTERHEDTVRIISARNATSREIGLYRAYMEQTS
jgi:uncharacterized DUF497 family protein